MKRSISLSKMTRQAPIVANSLDRENRTFDIVWTTGARVNRYDYWTGQRWIEELGLKRTEVDLTRLKNGAPFLDNHGNTEARGVKQVLGVHLDAKLEPNERGTATIKLSKRTEADGIMDDIEDGILRNVSVGYDIEKMRKVGEEGEGDDAVPIIRATRWLPIENSLVPAGADDDAMVRGKDESSKRTIEVDDWDEPEEEPTENGVATPEDIRHTEPNNNGDAPMTPEEIKAAKEKREQEEKEIRAKAKADEKERQVQIRATVSKVGLKPELAETYIEEDKTIEQVRELVIEARSEADKAPEAQTRGSNSTAEVGEDLSRKSRIEGMENAILHRYRPTTEKRMVNGVEEVRKGYELSEQGKRFAFRSLHELARMCLDENNFRTGGLTKNQIVEKALGLRSAHSISDFSEILANTVNRTLRDGYLAAPQTWQPFTREVFEPDFKQISRTNLGDAPELLEVNEGGEVRRGTLSETAEKYNIVEFARIVAITRKVIVNDDLSAMTRIPERMGRRAADLESDTVWNIIKDNAAMADTFALFSAAHGNLSTTPAAPDEAGLQEARAAMRRQVGLDGAEISLAPVWFYVPPAHETVAEKLVATITPTESGNVSPFSSSGRTPLRLAVEPRLETGANGSLTAWYVMASLSQIDMVELARLEGTNGPQTSSREGFDVAGLEMKIAHDIGAKSIDHRGLFKNAGA